MSDFSASKKIRTPRVFQWSMVLRSDTACSFLKTSQDHPLANTCLSAHHPTKQRRCPRASEERARKWGALLRIGECLVPFARHAFLKVFFWTPARDTHSTQPYTDDSYEVLLCTFGDGLSIFGCGRVEWSPPNNGLLSGRPPVSWIDRHFAAYFAPGNIQNERCTSVHMLTPKTN